MPVTALLIDDSATARQMIAYHLHQVGCDIVGEAETAAEGLKLFNELKPKLVTLDLMMPKKDGFEAMALVDAIKQEAPETAIIVVTVISFEKIRTKFLNKGVLAYVIKPFNRYTLESLEVKLNRRFPELLYAKKTKASI